MFRPSIKFDSKRNRPVFIIQEKKTGVWKPIPDLEFDREADRDARLAELRKLETFEV